MEYAASRQAVFIAIESERDYQDAIWKDAPTTYKGQHEIGAFLTMFRSYLAWAEEAWTSSDGDTEALEIIRKLAGIAVNCMEQHGAPQREGYER